MSEYINVEKPFLHKLSQIGWQVIDQGQGIPQEPAKSLRSSFDEVALRQEFMTSVGALNPWATPEQLTYCFERVLLQTAKLTEANKAAYMMMLKGITLPGKNQLTGLENPTVKLVDFDNWKANSFIAMNQFRIDTPTMAKKFIIPDIVCFVNGLPWVVVECKDLYVAEPLSDAYTQIKRYSNQRDEDDYYSQPEGKEQLFFTNLFSVITYGTEARFGSISAEFDYFYNWTDIFPEIYKTVETKEGGVKQEVIIGGMFNHEILVDIFRNFTLFMSAGEKEIKVICRYQQYRAVGKMVQRLKLGETWRERSGVVWHTQGSGKSLTMVFLVKKMRSEFDLRDYKILMIVDRIDLEEQLKDTAALTGERVNSVVGKTRVPKASKNEKALVQLDDNTPDLNLVMIHKFGINQDVNQDILYKLGVVPKFEAFDTINPSEKVLILIDEAHRSQNGDMSKNLFVAFPQATRFGFTGTPLITERHKFTTAERFCQPAGEFIDTYKMNNAVADRATVDVKYIGKSTYDEIKDKEVFDLEYEETFKERTEEERQEILKRYGGMIEFLESQQRVQKISTDILNHYVADILTNGFKAMVVTASVTAAVRYKYEIEQLIPSYIAAEESKTDEERDDELLARLRILKVRAVVSMQSNNEPAYITKARKEGSGDEVVKAFKKSFNTADPTKSDTGIAILCVCDRLLTGFDAPIAQVLYMDKNLREHDLLQAIARVNRTKKGKTHGLVVDYFGITKNLAKALGIYTDKEAEENREELLEFGEYFKDINKEIPELELRYQKIVQLFEANQIDKITDFLHQKITASKEEFEVVEAIIELAATLKFRSELDLLVRNYFDRLDLLFNVPEVQAHHWIPAKRLGYLLWRIRYHYKDDTLDLKWASAKVRKLIDKHLIHIGIVTRVAEVSMLSDDFPKKIDSLYRGSKSRASAMEHAVRHQIKVKLENNDPALYVRFKDKLEYIINQYQGNWDLMIKELEDLQSEINQGRKADYRFKSVQLPFYDYLKLNIAEEVTEELDAKVASITKLICSYIKEGIEIANFWEKMDEVKKVKDKIASRLRLSGINSFREKNGEISSQLMLMAKNNFVELIRHIHEMAE